MALGGPEWFTISTATTGAERDTIEYPCSTRILPTGATRTVTGRTATPAGLRREGCRRCQRSSKRHLGPRVLHLPDHICDDLPQWAYWAKKNWVYDSVTSIPNGGGDHSCHGLRIVDGDGARRSSLATRTSTSDGTFKV